MGSPIFLTKIQKQGIIKDSLGGESMMMQITEENKAAVLEKIKQGGVDDATTSGENFVETIMKKMLVMGWEGETEQGATVSGALRVQRRISEVYV
jgi:hypothetical protein